MRLYSIHLVAAVTLFACVEASALESQPEPTLPETSGHTSDQTFPQNGATTDEEERMPSSNAFHGIRGTTNLFKPMRSNFAEKHQQWMKELEGKSAQEAFTFMKLDKAGNDVFRSDNFRHWKHFVANAQEENPYIAMVKVLLYHFGNLRLADMLDAAKKDYKTNPIAIALEDAFISLWQNSNLGIAFDELRFKSKSDPLHIPFFKIWYKSAKKKEGSPEQVVKFLAERLGDLSFTQMLDAAKAVDSMKAIAIELEDAYISLCQRSKLGIEFDEMGFEAKSNGLLRNPLFKTWYNHAKDEWSPIKVMVFLRTRFGDFNFTKMLDAAKKVASTKAFAIELKNAYISLWQGTNPSVLFNEVGLDAKSSYLLHIPLFKTWYEFAKKENWPPTLVMKFLKGESEEFRYARMLDAASKVEDTEAIAIELLEVLFDHWSRIELSGGAKMRPARPISLLRKMELGKTVSADDFSVWWKYAEWRRKKGIPEKATDSARAL